MQHAELKSKKIPTAPGVYFFLGERKVGGMAGREILYIGKAAVLRERLRSYFAKRLDEARSPAIVHMVEAARDIAWQETDSVLEALILEAALIKKYAPRFNVREKDDRSFNYVAITDERFPRVLIVRGRDITMGKFTAKTKHIFGPFPQAGVLRDALAIVRKIFPFHDTCTPLDPTAKKVAKPCFNRQIGLCPGVCTGEVSAREYGRTIRNVALFFEGKKKVLLQKLKREMDTAAKARRFEDAGEIKKTIFSLTHIREVALIRNEPEPRRDSQNNQSYRIESYDVAHLAGGAPVGVMVVVEDGELQKSEYRLFTIRSEKKGSDADALREILARRIAHTEWRSPDMIVVDGGIIQRRIAQKAFEKTPTPPAIVNVVKDERHRPKAVQGHVQLIRTYERAILLANGEAHRFAIAAHRRKRSKDFL